MNDCTCTSCRRLDRGEWQGGPKVVAKRAIRGSNGDVVAWRGTVGDLEDVDRADRYLIVTFPDQEPELVYPHEVQYP